MNKLKRLFTQSRFQTQAIISIVFISLIIVFVLSLESYWQNTLKPRLYLAAQTQAKVLAESQATVLLETLTRTETQHLSNALTSALQVMLIVEDPAIGERFIRSVALQLDYSVFDVVENSLDVSEGDNVCSDCFVTEVPLITRDGELLGLATFSVSGRYFSVLSEEMQSKLFAESSLTLALLISVWFLMLFMFYRLDKAKRIIEASNNAKTRFLANVTHELRTPLNVILGNTQLYKNQAEFMALHGQGIEAINQSAEHLLLMINDVLDFSKADQAHMQLHPNELALPDFLNTLLEMTKVSAKIKHLSLNASIDATIPPMVIADEKRLRQVLLNLLSNAVKFTEQGEVSFSVAVKAISQQKVTLVFSVQDTGIGIDKSQLASIFIPFHQLDNAITRAQGSGLGLTISQKILALMNSKLTVSSEPAVGSCFRFELSLPVVAQLEHPQQVAESVQDHNKNEGSTTPLIMPSDTQLELLMGHAQRHNVLAIRALISELESDVALAPFLAEIKPFIDHYRFKALLEWLEKNTQD